MRSLLVSVVLAVACGTDSTSGLSDAGTDAGTSACSTTPAAGQPAFGGSVDFGATSSTSFDADATFRGNFGGAALQASGCSGTQVGSCCFVPHGGPSCPFPDEASAGNIAISKGGAQIAQLTVANNYDADTSTTSTLTWQPGDTLSVSAAGSPGQVAAFSGSVVVPAPLTGIAPAISGTVTIPKANDFVVSWTPGTGTATVQLFLEDIPLNGIGCTAPVTAGSITVPASLLNMLGGSGSIIVTNFSQTAATASNAAVSLRVDATIAIAGATYQ
jgi:hypothetical protein